METVEEKKNNSNEGHIGQKAKKAVGALKTNEHKTRMLLFDSATRGPIQGVVWDTAGKGRTDLVEI